MKKLLAMIFVLALASVMSLTAFAATPITSVGGSDSAEVKGTYAAGSATPTVYKVDISWGSMEFTYTAASQEWDPTTHSYKESTTAAWTCAEGANKITVTNHSNADVKASLTYTASADYAGISGTFSANELSLKTAVGTTVANAPTASATLTLAGDLAADADDVTIGTVTVKLGN